MQKMSMLFSTLLFSICLAIPGAQSQNLATIKADAQSTELDGRTLATARNHHFVVDAPPPLGGPNEALNPIELLMTSLATCGVLVSKKVAAELDLPLTHAKASAEGDLDPRGVKGEAIDPRIQVFRVQLELTGVSEAEGKQLLEAVKIRCPIYTTLQRAAPIEVKLICNETIKE